MRACCLGRLLFEPVIGSGQLGPARTVELDPASKTKKIGRVWALGPTNPNCVC